VPGDGLAIPGFVRSLKSRLWDGAASRRAVRRATRFCDSNPAATRVCWDLDNTLIDTGSLLRAGHTLDEAAALASPVPNMLLFFEALQKSLPGAQHFALSARQGALRTDTLAWLSRHRVTLSPAQVYLVPEADAKPAIWHALARDASLVIVDDLTFDHESAELSHYTDLVEQATETAAAYVGHRVISQVATGELAVPAAVSETIAGLSSSPSS